ncbi:MAG: polyisoprenoid-binding protein, partial [Luteimonas sp.]
MKRTFLTAALAVSATLFATATIAAPTTYKIDPSHTVVLAGWSHFGFSHPVADFG